MNAKELRVLVQWRGGELKCGSQGEGVLTGPPFEPFCPRGPYGVETERDGVLAGSPWWPPPHKPFILTATPGGPGGPREPLGPGRPWRKDIRVITDRVPLHVPEKPPVPSRHSLQPSGSQIGPHFPQTQPLSFQTQASLTPTACKQAHLCLPNQPLL